MSKQKTQAGGTLIRKRDPMKQPYAADDQDLAQRTNLNGVQGNKDSSTVLDTAATLKTASRHALGDQYPLDAWSDVQAAVNYFCENYKFMPPPDRHEFAVKTASRAEELGMDTPAILDRYGSTSYADDVDGHIAQRKAMTNKDHFEMYDALLEKKASIAPETFAQILGEADEVAGLNWFYDGAVDDPYFSTFGGPSAKKKTASAVFNAGGESVTAEELHGLAERGGLKGHFEDYLVQGFAQEPVAIFESLPDTHKSIIARLAKG